MRWYCKGDLKFHIGFQYITSEHIEHCYFVDPQGSSWRSTYQTGKTLDYLQINFSKSTIEETNKLWLQLSVLSKMEHPTVYLSVL